MLTKNEGAERRATLAELMRRERVAAFITTALPNVRYLSGFTGSNGALVMTLDDALLITDPRYTTQASAEADCPVRIAKGPVLKEVGKWLGSHKARSLAYEHNRLSLAEFDLLKTSTPKTRLKPASEWVESLRSVKSPTEIELIRKSVALNSQAVEQALPRVRIDKTSEVELAAEIEYRMRRLKADGPAFATIVASGARAALPHAHPTANRIDGNELLLIDVGANVAGYCSDMTRTYATGKLSGRKRQMYKAVLQSQLAAIDAIRPGVSTAAVDGAARNVLREYGWEKLFVHSTGHGLGLEIHERPRVGRKDKTKLKAGMIITVEPGIYEENVGGIRIEDTVLVTAAGCEPLTPTSKQLTEL